MIAEYREIARVYHPDISTDPKANEVMAKVNQLYEEALRLIDAGTWEVSNQIILKDKSGKKYVGRYLKQVPFELGEHISQIRPLHICLRRKIKSFLITQWSKSKD